MVAFTLIANRQVFIRVVKFWSQFNSFKVIFHGFMVMLPVVILIHQGVAQIVIGAGIIGIVLYGFSEHGFGGRIILLCHKGITQVAVGLCIILLACNGFFKMLDG